MDRENFLDIERNSTSTGHYKIINKYQFTSLDVLAVSLTEEVKKRFSVHITFLNYLELVAPNRRQLRKKPTKRLIVRDS